MEGREGHGWALGVTSHVRLINNYSICRYCGEQAWS
jgi:hypothetical protein